MRRALAALLASSVLLTACVETIAESRVRAALLEAGLSERNADCMAGRMVDRLTIAQLRKLEALKSADGETAPVGLQDYLERVRRVGDSEVIAVTASSAALCATGLAG